MRFKLAAVAVCTFSMGLAACGDDKKDDNINPAAVACGENTTAKEAQLSAQLASAVSTDAPEMVDTTNDQSHVSFAGHYRDNLAVHPGCTPRSGGYTANTSEPLVLDNEAAVPAGGALSLDGFPCAAKDYAQDNEDTSKPIVITVHGNSSGVTSFEEYFKQSLAGQTAHNLNAPAFEFTIETTMREQLVTKLLAEGYRVIGFDARSDRVAAQTGFTPEYQQTKNPAFNRDHGWDVPMLQSLIRAVINNNPGRKISLVTHSLGTTVARDALRRLYNEYKAGVSGAVNPFAHIQDAVWLSGANHGVASGTALCSSVAEGSMRYSTACEMGDRAAYTPTYFTSRINGPSDLWSTPCADGSYAFGDRDACDDNVVQYTTITMADIPNGGLQDEFVSEASARLDNNGCVENITTTLADFDASGFFFIGFPGAFANHFGAARAEAGMNNILAKLGD